MNDKFENQKEKLIFIKHEISLLYHQVNYLLRNEQAIELLDLDVLMNRTHRIYDQLCCINLGDGSLDEELPLDAEALSGLFGNIQQEEPCGNAEGETVAMEEEPDIEAPKIEPEAVAHPEPVEDARVGNEPQPVAVTVEETLPEVEPQTVEEMQPEPESKPLGDEFGFFFRFEDIPKRKEPEVKPVAGGKVVHVMEAIPEEEIPERDRVHGEDLVKDNPLVMPRLDEERMAEREEIEQQSSGGMPNFFSQDDTGFELSTGETLGDKMMGADLSLAAKLQQNPVRSLKSVIGINDKFLFVNELFGGSMEKYNKSIDNLNDLKTLNGAMIYLNELKIELLWNSSNEAYLKLKELVSRKFE